MALTINTNVSALTAQRNLTKSQSAPLRARTREGQVAVEAWWDRETVLRLPVSAEQFAVAESPGPHPVELVVADGALGIEYVEAVQVVPAE